MLGFFVAGLIATGPLATPTSPPGPPRLRIITTVKSTEFCTAVREMAIPIGFVTRRNADALDVLAGNMSRAMASNGYYLTKDRPAPVNMWSVNTAMISTREITYQIEQNLVTEDNLMDQAWARTPRGVDTNVDALRQRLQNLMDLQQALVNKYIQVQDGYTNCQGGANSSTQCSAGAVNIGVDYGDAMALAGLETTNDPEDLPQISAHDVAHFGSVADISRELTFQEAAFSQEITASATTCGI